MSQTKEGSEKKMEMNESARYELKNELWAALRQFHNENPEDLMTTLLDFVKEVHEDFASGAPVMGKTQRRKGAVKKLPEGWYVGFNNRTDLPEKIEKYWCGHKTSNIGLQYLTYKNGRIHADDGWERTDIFCVQHFKKGKGCNVFVEANGSISVQPWEDGSKDRALMDEGRSAGLFVFHNPANQAYIQKHQKFFAEKPWLQVDGMTPEEAVQKFHELGW